MTARTVTVFVAPTGNGFMRDIAAWIVEAAQSAGRTARLVEDRLPVDDGSTNLVVAPHEFYLLRDDPDRAVRAAARCSVPICTEQPGTPWFHMALGFCLGSPIVVDINTNGVGAIERAGFRARRLELGGVPSMDRSGPERDVDVLFLGGATDRRAALLARLGPVLWDMHADIRMFSSARPVQGDEVGIVFGDDKYDLLARSKVLVNLHRSDDSDGYFEWARMVEAMANRCVVLTEPSRGFEPLVAGEHFIEFAPDDIADTVIEALADDVMRERVANAAHDAVMRRWPLNAAVTDMLDAIERVPPVKLSVRQQIALRRPIERTHRPPLLPVFNPFGGLRRNVYDQLLAEMGHRREIGRVRCLVEHGTDDHVGETATPAYAAATPDVSVIVTLYNYADVVSETIESIIASSDVAIEIVVVDDHSSDGGSETVRSLMELNPAVPMLLLSSHVNRGLPRSRNMAIERCRAAKIMVMDADNTVYPTCLRRLSDALDDHPDASFAYATLEAFGSDPGLRSSRGWHVPWLCDGNYIDAQAMLRRSAWEEHGGYRVADEVHGWEDWDLWLRMAVAGSHGIHLPQMLGRYRTQPDSMITTTNLVADDLRAGLVQRYPTLPWPEHERS